MDDGYYNVGQPEYIGAFPIRSELEFLQDGYQMTKLISDTRIKYGVVVHNYPISGSEVWCANVDSDGKIYSYDINKAYQKREQMEINHHPIEYTVERFDEQFAELRDGGYYYRIETNKKIKCLT